VSLLPAATAIIAALGADHLRVARSSADPADPHRPLPSVGGILSPNLERLAAARPDLLVVWPDLPAEPLRRTLAPGGRLVRLEIDGLDGLRDAIRRLGRLLRLQTAADSLLAGLEVDLSRARGVAPEPTPSVVWIVGSDPLVAAGPGSFVDEVLLRAGGRNAVPPGSSPWPRLAPEALVALEPDVVVWPRGGGLPEPPGPGEASPPWSLLRAVRQGRVLEVEAAHYHVPAPHTGTAILELAHRLAAVMGLGSPEASLP
jgi:ABC-type Fe3+-hydroxamate transport system substrate-binding protein